MPLKNANVQVIEETKAVSSPKALNAEHFKLIVELMTDPSNQKHIQPLKEIFNFIMDKSIPSHTQFTQTDPSECEQVIPTDNATECTQVISTDDPIIVGSQENPMTNQEMDDLIRTVGTAHIFLKSYGYHIGQLSDVDELAKNNWVIRKYLGDLAVVKNLNSRKINQISEYVCGNTDSDHIRHIIHLLKETGFSFETHEWLHAMSEAKTLFECKPFIRFFRGEKTKIVIHFYEYLMHPIREFKFNRTIEQSVVEFNLNMDRDELHFELNGKPYICLGDPKLKFQSIYTILHFEF